MSQKADIDFLPTKLDRAVLIGSLNYRSLHSRETRDQEMHPLAEKELLIRMKLPLMW